MPTIACMRCGREGPLMEKPPFKDELGREVYEHTCADCWKEWLGYQVKLINELSLLPVNPEHGAILEKNLKSFLRLPSAEDDAVDDVGAPPAP